MQVGDLVRVKLPGCIEYIAVITRLNGREGGLARSVDSRFPGLEHWVADWSSEVVSGAA
jgi:hypothetical protein